MASDADWNTLDNKPSEFTPEEHDNTKHTTNYASESSFNDHLNNNDDPHSYEDTEEINVKYKLVMINGKLHMEVVAVE